MTRTIRGGAVLVTGYYRSLRHEYACTNVRYDTRHGYTNYKQQSYDLLYSLARRNALMYERIQYRMVT